MKKILSTSQNMDDINVPAFLVANGEVGQLLFTVLSADVTLKCSDRSQFCPLLQTDAKCLS